MNLNVHSLQEEDGVAVRLYVIVEGNQREVSSAHVRRLQPEDLTLYDHLAKQRRLLTEASRE